MKAKERLRRTICAFTNAITETRRAKARGRRTKRNCAYSSAEAAKSNVLSLQSAADLKNLRMEFISFCCRHVLNSRKPKAKMASRERKCNLLHLQHTNINAAQGLAVPCKWSTVCSLPPTVNAPGVKTTSVLTNSIRKACRRLSMPRVVWRFPSASVS